MPSLVAEIGHVIEDHMKKIGMIKTPELDQHQREFLDAKRKEFEDKTNANQSANTNTEFPPNATMCDKCHAKAVVIMDGCKTCLSCGDSKCG